jgi:LPS-assembly protein
MAAVVSEGIPAVRRTTLRLLPLCLAVSAAVHAEEAKPNWGLCRVPDTLPMFAEQDPKANMSRDAAPTDIEADALDVKEKERTIFSGNVKLVHGDQYMATDKVTFEHESEQFRTEGQVRYQDHAIRLTAASAMGDQKQDKLSLEKVVYQFNEETGNGTAETAQMQRGIGTLTQATYSTCPPGQRQWEFRASKITVNDETKTGVARNATMFLGKVPVLWLPIVSFPTTDERRTGLLAPTLGRDDKNGLDIKLPVYLNLAPNYDATITPRWLSKRGLMLGGEFRYVTQDSVGRFDGNWLPDDDQYIIDGKQRDRGYAAFEDNTRINRHWYFATHLKNVSDRDYFGDFGDGIDYTSISLLASDIGVYGRGTYWSASVSAESWQIASPLVRDGDEPYRRLPQLQASAGRPLSRWFETGVDFEAVRFEHDELDPLVPANQRRYEGGDRVDVRPWMRARFGGPAWFVVPELSWRYTRYDSLSGRPVEVLGRPESATRSLPIASLDAGAYFERDFDWHEHDYVQTLEPRLYYLYVPYRDQVFLPVFDTRELTFSWNSLFRDNRFGGADRQSDANQVALALTTRILRGDDGTERFMAGLGRIHYFEDPRVKLLPGDPDPVGEGSPWIATLGISLADWWSLGITQQWDPDGHRTDLSSVRTQFRYGKGGIVNASYRFRRPGFGLQPLEQTDLSFVIPVNQNWNLYGRWNYSIMDNQTIEALAGFEWKSCCMAVRLLGRQYIRSVSSRENFGLYLEIELNGLGSFGRDTARLLDDAILGYTR